MQNASDILGLLISILLLKFFHQPRFCCCAHHKIEVFNFNHRTGELCKNPQLFLPFFKFYADINMNLLPPYVFIGWANLWVANMPDPEIIGICFIPCTSKCILWPAYPVFGNFKMCCISAFRFHWWFKNCKGNVCTNNGVLWSTFFVGKFHTNFQIFCWWIKNSKESVEQVWYSAAQKTEHNLGIMRYHCFSD